MSRHTSRVITGWLRVALVVAVAAVSLVACGGDDDDDADAAGDEGETPSGPEELVGLFGIEPGTCTDAGVTQGSWFRMVQSGGTVDAGPFVENGDSPCGDKTWNPLLPGSDGGLRTGAHQPFAEPVFDEAGNATAAHLTEPVRFFAVGFSVATNETDPQTGEAVPPPAVTADGGTLTADLRAFAAAWNNQHFNQGSPKPDGSKPGVTTDVTGTYDPDTRSYTLEWATQIVGGPFNNFAGVWHLEGTFEPTG